MNPEDRLKAGHQRRIWIAVVVVAIYVNSFLIWSRLAERHMRQFDSDGYYFIMPAVNGRPAYVEQAIRVFYFPCIVLDKALGGPGLCSEPMMDLSLAPGQETNFEDRLKAGHQLDS